MALVAPASGRLTYRELDARAEPAGAPPAGAGASVPRSLVGVLLERTAELIVALLAVLKAAAPTCRSIPTTRGSACC